MLDIEERAIRPPPDYVPHTATSCTSTQIVTSIEVNSEAYFPKLQEYCVSAEGKWAIFLQLREIRLTIDRR